MRILLITPFFYPHESGSQRYAEELYVALRKIDKQTQVDVICYNTDNAKEKETYRGLTIYRIPCLQILPGQFAVPNYLKLWQVIQMLKKSHTYNLINAHTRFFESTWWGLLLAKYFKTTSMLTDHCATHPIHKTGVISFIAQAIDKTLVPFVAQKYDVVTVTNKATFGFIESLGVEKPKLIYGGVDTNLYNSKSKPCTHDLTVGALGVSLCEHGVDPRSDERGIWVQGKSATRRVVVTFVGRMIYSKGPQILFEIAKEIIKENSKVYFIFAGDGAMRKKLSLDKNPQILFTGSLKRTEVAKLLKNTDILVHPSLHHEGFPNVLLEAGASGCSVIATDMGGTREIIINNKTGLLVKPEKEAIKNALLTLLSNPKKRLILEKQLQKMVQGNFTWNTIAKEFQKLLKGITLSNPKVAFGTIVPSK